MAKKSKKTKAKKHVVKKTKQARQTPIKKTSKKSVFNPSSNFSNYNRVRTSVAHYLNASEKKYSLKELNKYSSDIYRKILNTYNGDKLKVAGFFKYSYDDINSIIKGYFTPNLEGGGVKRLALIGAWWKLEDEINDNIPASYYIYVDNEELVPVEYDFVKYEGIATLFSNSAIAFRKFANNYQDNETEEGKLYLNYLQLAFRSEALSKEFVMYVLIKENDAISKASNEAILEWLAKEKNINIEEIFNNIKNKTSKEDSVFSKANPDETIAKIREEEIAKGETVKPTKTTSKISEEIELEKAKKETAEAQKGLEKSKSINEIISMMKKGDISKKEMIELIKEVNKN